MLELWSRGDEEGAEPWRLGWLSLLLAESKGIRIGSGSRPILLRRLIL